MKRPILLTEEQHQALLHRYQTETNPRLRSRVHCLLLKGQGYTNRETARILQTSEHSVNDWIDRYEEGGLERLCGWEVGGSTVKLSKEQLQRLKTELDKQEFSTAKQVCHWVEQELGVPYSERGMRNLLSRLRYTYQKVRLLPSQSDPQKQSLFFREV